MEVQEEEIRKNTYTGRPNGRTDFIEELETPLGLRLKRQKPGRKNEIGNLSPWPSSIA